MGWIRLVELLWHRFYGQSMPFDSKEEAYKSAETLGYFNSMQALADYAQFIKYLKANLSAENSPVIAVGGSYGGMLAAWLRLKYPELVVGALASSAPILYFDNVTAPSGYFRVITQDFQDASESCYQTIKDSWSKIDAVASQPDGLKLLSDTFKICDTLENTQTLKSVLRYYYMFAAQYDAPPAYPVKMMCDAIDGAPEGASILERILSGLEASAGKQKCYTMGYTDGTFHPQPSSGWDWQKCTEMVMPIGCGPNETMFEAIPFDLKNYSRACKSVFGVTPRPHWIITEYGGNSTKLTLENFGSNIIFSNGLRDPYSCAGVIEDISDTIVAIYRKEGSHCLDLLASSPDDPEWLVSMRNEEREMMEGWVAEYNAKLKIKKISTAPTQLLSNYSHVLNFVFPIWCYLYLWGL